MQGTEILRFGSDGKVFGVCLRTCTGDCGKVRSTAEGYACDILRLLKFGQGQFRVNPVHDCGPENFAVGVPDGAGGELLIVVEAAPDTAGVIRCVAHKPDVLVAGGRSCFSGDRLSGSRDASVGGAGFR